MYWIYLLLFIVIVFVPEFVQGEPFGLKEVVAEELLLFICASIGFTLFLYREKQLIDGEQEKTKLQREINRISKDLTSSYSYIGEINRKLDILKAIVMGIANAQNITRAKEIALYRSILSAVEVMTKSNSIALRFIQKPRTILKEVKTTNGMRLDEQSNASCFNKHAYVETERYVVARCPHDVQKIRACIVIEKKPGTKRIEDPQLLKALASLAVFLYVYIQNANGCKLENLKK